MSSQLSPGIESHALSDTPPPAVPPPNEVALAAREVIAHHSKSFALAAQLLPASLRTDAAVIYSWCRRVDDAIDLAPNTEAALAALQQERCALDDVYSERAIGDRLLAAFQAVVKKWNIPRRLPEELLAGMQMDVDGQWYLTLGELQLYSYRVAGTVGMMMTCAMGVSEPWALKHASHLGIAMQITNICRDVAEDWARGRLYLPSVFLQRVGMEDLPFRMGSPLQADDGKRLARVVESLLDIADAYYRSADRGLRMLSWRCALSIRTARWVYSDIGRALARRKYDVLQGRAVVSLPRKLWLLLRAVGRAVLESPWRLFHPFRRCTLRERGATDELIRL
jgi:phytoene synthase